nr:MAG TPA: hypothetical protein [Bacteriophage sp.]
MELVIESFYALPCELKVFTINGKKANSFDFGMTSDHKEDYDDDEIAAYCCCDRYFESVCPTEKVLRKYNITKKEYYDICRELENKLHVDRCGWCI